MLRVPLRLIDDFLRGLGSISFGKMAGFFAGGGDPLVSACVQKFLDRAPCPGDLRGPSSFRSGGHSLQGWLWEGETGGGGGSQGPVFYGRRRKRIVDWVLDAEELSPTKQSESRRLFIVGTGNVQAVASLLIRLLRLPRLSRCTS